jgi:predicted protein tyrosine phosphatase
MKLLFICSRNQWRSPTAEKLFKNRHDTEARSAGTSSSARIKVNAQMIDWADIIFVMEQKHLQRLQEKFDDETSDKVIHVLHIPDEYKFMDEELIEILQSSVHHILNQK